MSDESNSDATSVLKQELRQLPAPAMVAFAVRYIRRAQPLYHASSPGGEFVHELAVERAIRAALRLTVWTEETDLSLEIALAKTAGAAAEAAAEVLAAPAREVAQLAAAVAYAAIDKDSANELANAAPDVMTLPAVRSDYVALREQFRHKDWLDQVVVPQTIFYPLWSVATSTLESSALNAERLREIISDHIRRFTRWQPVILVAQWLRRIQYLVDLDPSIDTTGLTHAIWFVENVAWDQSGARSIPAAGYSPATFTSNSLTRRDVVEHVRSATMSALLSAASACSGTDCLDSLTATLDSACIAAETADRLASQCHHLRVGASHLDTLIAGIGFDLWRLLNYSGDWNDRPESLGAIWDFSVDPNLGTNLKSLPVPPLPSPLLIGPVGGMSEEVQRKIENLAIQLIGSEKAVRRWFELPSPDLGNKTPREILASGNGSLLEWHIRSSINGEFG